MDGGEDEVILFEQRRAGEVLGAARRIERQFGEHFAAVAEVGGDLLELLQVADAHGGLVVALLEDGGIEAAGFGDLLLQGQLVARRG